jgi:hypothetical protein
MKGYSWQFPRLNLDFEEISRINKLWDELRAIVNAADSSHDAIVAAWCAISDFIQVGLFFSTRNGGQVAFILINLHQAYELAHGLESLIINNFEQPTTASDPPVEGDDELPPLID